MSTRSATRIINSEAKVAIALSLLAFAFLLGRTEAQTKLSNACRINQFRCSDGSRCLTSEKLCNGRMDCPKGEDEKGTPQWDCSKTTLSTDCDSRTEYKCRFGGCIARDKICDGVADCWGGIDESIEECTQRKRVRPTRPVSVNSNPNPPSTTERERERPTNPTTRRNQYQPPPPPPTPPSRPDPAPAPAPAPQDFNVPPGNCPPIQEDHSLGYNIDCRNNHGKGISCTSPLPEGSEATYTCRKYYNYPTVGSRSTVRACENGRWSARRPSFICSLDCGIGGKENVQLVTGGSSSKKGKWPWHVGLFQQDPPKSGKWVLQCGGSLISNNAVLTAAHCVTRKGSGITLNPGDMRVSLGKFYRDYNEREPHAQKMNVRAIEKHAEYNHYNLDNDIAIVFLDRRAEITDYVRPVCIPSSDNTYDSSPGKSGNLVGWGRAAGGGFLKDLQEAIIPVVDKNTCKQAHPTFAQLVRGSTFCAGYRNGTSACDGDSGGGLVFLDEDTRTKFNVHGIVSAGVAKSTGAGGCSEDYYAVFTRVLSFESWIYQKLDTNFLKK